jgi:hypothetical protein
MTNRVLKGLAVVAAGFIATAPATAAVAQTTAPATPPASAPTDSMAPPVDSMAPADSMAKPPADSMSAMPMQKDAMASPMLEKRNGKWYNGEREATKAEIDSYNKSMKPKPR